MDDDALAGSGDLQLEGSRYSPEVPPPARRHGNSPEPPEGSLGNDRHRGQTLDSLDHRADRPN
eukprot:6196122-Pyramimonas_sp.AAC.1